jgi:hypothetical protein
VQSRGSVQSGTGVQDSVVNQLLSKIDGVNSLNNILLIGMTNRIDMLDEALLRPGRLELKIQIGVCVCVCFCRCCRSRIECLLVIFTFIWLGDASLTCRPAR